MKVDRGEGIEQHTPDEDGRLLKREMVIQDGVPMTRIYFGGVSIYATGEEMVSLLAELRDAADELDSHERKHKQDLEDYARLYKKFGGVNPALPAGMTQLPAVTHTLTSSVPQVQTLPRKGLHCSVCGRVQFHSEGGMTCENGHGGALSQEEVQGVCWPMPVPPLSPKPTPKPATPAINIRIGEEDGDEAYHRYLTKFPGKEE